MLLNLRFQVPVSQQRASNRRGLTVLEFLGCTTAVLGGMWIGALYLGVNIQHLAHGALHQAQLLEKVPPEWRPEGPKQNVVTREQLLTTLRNELGSLRSEILALRNGTDINGTLQPGSDAAAAARDATRTYWTRLNEIALSEDDLQRDAETAIDNRNAAKVFAIKGRVSRFAAQGVDVLPSKDVSEEVVKFGRQLAVWYARGGELYDQAVQISEMPAGQPTRTQLTQDWKRGELQHRHEARLLRQRSAMLRASISRQFGEEFAEFAKPVVATPPAPPSDTSSQSK
jgi:hypothetical protein